MADVSANDAALNSRGRTHAHASPRVLAYYAGAATLIGFYGGQVCSFLETLGAGRIILIMGSAFGLALIARYLLEPHFVDCAPDVAQGRRQLVLDFGLFLAVGFGVTFWDIAVHRFPVVSGVKLTLGCATIGVFAAIDLALERERHVARRLIASGASGKLVRRGASVTLKLAVPALSLTALVATDVALLVNKDLDYLASAGPEEVGAARMAVVTEIGFVMAVLSVLLVVVIVSFSRNLRLFFDNETAILEDVAAGDLERYVPVASDDEFGLIASHTNQMIDGLRERRRVKQIFGKMVSPKLAKRILESDVGMRPSGTRRRVAVLFSDVRNFTTRTENSPAEEVVNDLNLYFEQMVAIVHRHGGGGDKFIGDGMMAVFGVEDVEGAADASVQAGIEMLAAVEELNPRLTAPIAIGVGVHIGDVIAGSIGSTERLEYTFIGDAVNVAARLEGLTKEVGAPLVVSAVTRDEIQDADLRRCLVDLGAHALKGKAQALPVWGVPAA